MDVRPFLLVIEAHMILFNKIKTIKFYIKRNRSMIKQNQDKKIYLFLLPSTLKSTNM